MTLFYFLQKQYGGFKGVLYIAIRIFLRSTISASVRKDVGRDLMLVLGRSTQSRACQQNLDTDQETWSVRFPHDKKFNLSVRKQQFG